MANIVCSTGTLPGAIQGAYHDLQAVFEVAGRLPAISLELVVHPDWREAEKPQTPQRLPWSAAPDWAWRELGEAVKRYGQVSGRKVISVHAYRDLGYFLTHRDRSINATGEALLRDCLNLAEFIDARMVVVHAWDTFTSDLNPAPSQAVLHQLAQEFPNIHLAVENIPVSDVNWTQVQLMQQFLEDPLLHMTLDLSWSSMYGNFVEFLQLRRRVINVHVQGALHMGSEETRFLPRQGSLSMTGAIQRLVRDGYDGQWTLELNPVKNVESFCQALALLCKLVQKP